MSKRISEYGKNIIAHRSAILTKAVIAQKAQTVGGPLFAQNAAYGQTTVPAGTSRLTV
jgi:hypothetical protein